MIFGFTLGPSIWFWVSQAISVMGSISWRGLQSNQSPISLVGHSHMLCVTIALVSYSRQDTTVLFLAEGSCRESISGNTIYVPPPYLRLDILIGRQSPLCCMIGRRHAETRRTRCCGKQSWAGLVPGGCSHGVRRLVGAARGRP